MFLRQSTAQTIRFGPFLDSTDGVTAETALTIAQADMQLSKDGGAFAQKSAAGNATHDTDGWYSTSLSTTDTATVGELIIQVVVAGSVPVWKTYWVIEEAVYDALYGAAATGFNASGQVVVASTASGAITAASLASDTITAAKIAANALTSAKIAADAIGASQLAADAIGASEISQAALDQVWTSAARTLTAGTNLNDPTAAVIADAVWDELQSAHVTAGSFGEIATEIASILADTNELQTDDVPGLIAALNNISTAQVNAEVVDALSTDTYAEPASVPAATVSLAVKIGWLFSLSRNKMTQTSSSQALRNDGDTANISTAVVSDNGTTATVDEWL